MKPRVTLKDIALHLGLSVSAISKALHNDPRISATQKKRVLRLAKKLGYHPDPGLSALASYRLKSGLRPSFAPLAYIGFTPYGKDWTSIFFRGAKQQARELGYELEYYWLSPDLTPKRHSRILHSRGIRGLIIAPLPNGTTTLELDWNLFSSIAVGRSLIHPELHRTSSDTFGALLQAFENVRQMKFKRIGIAITCEQDIRLGWRWTAATAVAQQRLCLPGQQILFFQDSEKRPAVFLKWLEEKKPEILLAISNPIYQWIRTAGYRIPQDFTYVSLSLYEAPSEKYNGPGIDQNFEAVGTAAMILLHSSLIRGEKGIPPSRLTQLVQSSWVDDAR